jgi:hypothetical protein
MRDAIAARAAARATAAATAAALLTGRPAAALGPVARRLWELRRETAGLLLLLLLLLLQESTTVGPSSEELRLAELGEADRPLCGREGRGKGG